MIRAYKNTKNNEDCGNERDTLLVGKKWMGKERWRGTGRGREIGKRKREREREVAEPKKLIYCIKGDMEVSRI